MRETTKSAADGDKLNDTARIDRRHTVLAQIEAALLASKLEIERTGLQRTGTDPYNNGVYEGIADIGVWNAKRPR